jgi:hypothetical protein
VVVREELVELVERGQRPAVVLVLERLERLQRLQLLKRLERLVVVVLLLLLLLLLLVKVVHTEVVVVHPLHQLLLPRLRARAYVRVRARPGGLGAVGAVLRGRAHGRAPSSCSSSCSLSKVLQQDRGGTFLSVHPVTPSALWRGDTQRRLQKLLAAYCCLLPLLCACVRVSVCALMNSGSGAVRVSCACKDCRERTTYPEKTKHKQFVLGSFNRYHVSERKGRGVGRLFDSISRVRPQRIDVTKRVANRTSLTKKFFVFLAFFGNSFSARR